MRAELIQKAADFLVATEGKRLPNGALPTQQMKMHWLMEEKGLTTDEYIEALNKASGGEVVRSALGQDA